LYSHVPILHYICITILEYNVIGRESSLKLSNCRPKLSPNLTVVIPEPFFAPNLGFKFPHLQLLLPYFPETGKYFGIYYLCFYIHRTTDNFVALVLSLLFLLQGDTASLRQPHLGLVSHRLA
jgi:hypothetical protein